MGKQGQGANRANGLGTAVSKSSETPNAVLRTARLERSLTQKVLAGLVGIPQDKISLLEHGRFDAVSRGKLLALVEFLGLDPDIFENVKDRLTIAYCPNPECPSAKAVPIGATIAMEPRFFTPEAGQGHCRNCGEVLLRRCEHCRAAASPGGPFCGNCGRPLAPIFGDYHQLRSKETEQWAIEFNTRNYI